VRLPVVVATLMMIGIFSGLCAAQETSREIQEKETAVDKKILVVYYSRTGNTKRVAEDIAASLKADIEEIVDIRDRSGFMGYMKAGRDAMKARLTEIGQMQKDPADYDVVIIGTPIWAWSMTPAVRTYMVKYKSAIKQAAFFTTAGGSKPDKIVKAMEELLGMKPLGTVGFVQKEFKSANKEIYDKKIVEFTTLLR